MTDGADQPTVLVVGASGVVGRSAAEAFAASGRYRTVMLSRRPPDPAVAAPHLAVDLADARALDAALAGQPPVSHVVYAALQERPDLVAGWRAGQQIADNRSLFAGLLDALHRHAPQLRHVSLLQGTKAYGAHVRRMRIPGREDGPRDPHANFYWEQEDLLRERAARDGWSWTILRPQVVCGLAVGSPMNVTLALAVLGALARAAGRPLAFPGSRRMLTEATDAALLGRALVWAADSPAAAGRTFNVTNGDPLHWFDLWPALADALGLAPGPAEPARLADTMPVQADAWAAIVRRHGLRPYPLDRLVGASWQYLDFVLGNGLEQPPPTLVSTIRIRQAGFADCIDTEAMFRRQFTELAAAGLVPPP